MNDIISRSVKKAQYPAAKKPVDLSRSDGKRPDGATQISWTRGKPLAWDITIPNTLANSYIVDTSTRATAAADRAVANKTAKYTDLAKTHHFVPIAVTGGAWDELALEFITELGRRIARITQEPRETRFLFQRLSISLQRGNAVAFRNAFSSEHYFLHHCRAIHTSNELIYNFQAYRLCAGGREKSSSNNNNNNNNNNNKIKEIKETSYIFPQV